MLKPSRRSIGTLIIILKNIAVKEDKMYTRDGRYIDPQHVWEVDKDGFVVSSFRFVIFDFNNK